MTEWAIINDTVEDLTGGIREEDRSTGWEREFTDYGELHRQRGAIVVDNSQMIIGFLIYESDGDHALLPAMTLGIWITKLVVEKLNPVSTKG